MSPDISHVRQSLRENAYQILPSVIFKAVGFIASVSEDICSQAIRKQVSTECLQGVMY